MSNIEGKKIHFIGIKGVGMAALAVFAKEKGYEVTGSDSPESFVTDEILKNAGIAVSEFNPDNLKMKPDLVVCSAAFGKENPEAKEVQKRHLDIKNYSEALAMFAEDSQVIAISGIHGKTTTTAIVSYLLWQANLDPSFIVGAGLIPSLGSNAHYGKGDYFVLEADEYRKAVDDSAPKFLDLKPQIEIITSIELDHPDIYPSEEAVYNAFYKFACRVSRGGFIVLCIDYPKSRKLEHSLADRNFETYGMSVGATWQIIDLKDGGSQTSFWVKHGGQILGPFNLTLPGQANALNATAAIIVALKLGIGEKLLKKYLPKFSGVKRRFEKIGQAGEAIIIDDYAHHPRAVNLTLEAARQRYPDYKIWCIFQPHTYSRTKSLFSEFSQSFKLADKLIVTDIYASERENNPTISGEDLAQAIRKNQRSVKFISDWSKIVDEMAENINGKVVLITMGAGDIYKLGKQIFERLKNG